MSETSNETRAQRAENALRYYVESMGEVFENSSSEIAGLIADLLHLTAKMHEEVEGVLNLAMSRFEAEDHCGGQPDRSPVAILRPLTGS